MDFVSNVTITDSVENDTLNKNYKKNTEYETLKEKAYDTLPWIEKYRPKTLDEIISHQHITHSLKKFIESKTLPHLLFYGPPGSGKTSAIMACAKELYGNKLPLMVLELNASDERGIEIVRTRIKQFVTSKNVFYGDNYRDIFKLVILDETDAMTGDAQAILRQVVEKYTRNARFCLICNYIKKIIPALQSRCTCFSFPPLDKTSIMGKMDVVIEKENIEADYSGKETIIKRSNGDMRKVLNILQSTNMAYKCITSENVNNCLGYPQNSEIYQIMEKLVTLPLKEAYDNISKLKYESGLAMTDIIYEIHDIFLNKLLGNKLDPKIAKLLIKMSDDKIMFIINKMRDIEYNLSICTRETAQLGALIGLFKLV
jgi:replication factor C subunit 3/5